MASAEPETLKMAAVSSELIEPLESFRGGYRYSNPERWNFRIINLRKITGATPLLWKYFGSVPSSESTSERVSDVHLEMLKSPPSDGVQILWVGHATLLVQMGGKNILTDPMFSEVTGPNRLTGYRRYRKPAITVEELHKHNIPIHSVVISHNHYDHYDVQSVQDLCRCFPDIKWFVPAGVELYANSVKQLNWWGTETVDGIEYCFTPAKHWSGRKPWDWYNTLWGSWIIKRKNNTFFFAGDTGFEREIFTQIKDRYNEIDVAALPIGAYQPREVMKCQHINPEEAVQIHLLLGAKKSIGIHWRTFQLSTEGVDDPRDDLKKALSRNKLDGSEFVTLEKELITTYKCQGSISTVKPSE